MNILVLAPNGEKGIGEAQNYNDFYTELSRHANVVFAGKGYPLHRAGEPMDLTVKRVMPDADFVIDKDDNLHNPKPEDRSYGVGLFVSDLHAKWFYKVNNPRDHVKLINRAGYDVVFTRYLEVHGMDYSPQIYFEELKPDVEWVPWSIDVERFKPRKKTIDLVFLGSLYDCYPLRKVIWEGLQRRSDKYNVVVNQRPRGSPYELNVDELPKHFCVGDCYRFALGSAKTSPFGCSVYRYPLMRFFDTMASGCLVLSNPPVGARELGFVDGETYVEINEGNWLTELEYYLENEGERLKITEGARNNIETNHSNEVRVHQFLKILEDY